MAFDPVIFEAEWSKHWGSHHEAAHAVVARHFGLQVNHADMYRVNIDHRLYSSPNCVTSLQRLVVSAAGQAYTAKFLDFGGGGSMDDARSRTRLRDLGAGEPLMKSLMSEMHREADALVTTLRREIIGVALTLRARRALNQTEIDAAIEAARTSQKFTVADYSTSGNAQASRYTFESCTLSSAFFSQAHQGLRPICF